MLDLDEGSAGRGLLALVVALLEIIQEALVYAATRRVEGGALTDAEIDRLGDALAEIEDAMIGIKAENDVDDAVRDLRSSLDRVVGDVIDVVSGRPAGPSGGGRIESGRIESGRIANGQVHARHA